MTSIHPRYFTCTRAKLDLDDATIKIAEEHDLTWLELARMLIERSQQCLTYALREERHPDNPDKKADEA